MNIMRYTILFLLFVAFLFPFPGISQDKISNELRFEVNRVNPSLSVTRDQLNEASTLMDLNKHYKPSWVREYHSVEVLTSHKGRIMSALNKSEVLSQEQKDNMYKADEGSEIFVDVHYIPENTLKQNESKRLDFSFTVDPENDALYSGGKQTLMQYLKESAIEKVSGTNFDKSILAAVKFTVNEDGRVEDAHLFETSKDEKIDKLLLEAICNMPNWVPAAYNSGLKVKQEFVLTVGNLESCLIPLLNINQD